MADDLGYGDLGSYGQKLIQTPNLDRMAREGMRFTQFYAGSTVCAPSRSVLMTGQHMGRTFVRGNASGDMTKQTLRAEDFTVAELMKQAGYRTALIGKWGLGELGSSGHPLAKGFDYFFGYLNQRHAHNYYPEFLWRNEEKVPLRNEVTHTPGNYGGFVGGWATKRIDYSHDLVVDEALKWVQDNSDEPFFLYLALTIPHANNEGTRGTGDGMEVPDYGIYEERNWADPDKGQAAMITRMDRDIGRLLEILRTLNIDQQTLVIFTSDNGPHEEGGNDPELFDPNGPLRGKKRDLYEGGIRVPTLARWPGTIKADQVSDHVAYFGDLMATAADLTRQTQPENTDSVSFLPTLLGQTGMQRPHEYLYWEFYEGNGGSQAVRWGKWKGVRIPAASGPIQLFDLASDLGETTDLASREPKVVAEIEKLMTQAHEANPNWEFKTPE